MKKRKVIYRDRSGAEFDPDNEALIGSAVKFRVVTGHRNSQEISGEGELVGFCRYNGLVVDTGKSRTVYHNGFAAGTTSRINYKGELNRKDTNDSVIVYDLWRDRRYTRGDYDLSDKGTYVDLI